MKKALVGAALLLAPFFSFADIYENVYANGDSRNSSLQEDCDWRPIQYQIDQDKQYKSNAGYTETGDSTEIINGSLCRRTITYENDRGQPTYTRFQVGLSEVPKCPPVDTSPSGNALGLDGYILIKEMEDGTNQCFQPEDLAQADSCEQTDSNGNTETYISPVGGASCMPKSDGSVCPVQPSSVSEITTSSGETHYFYQSAPSDSTGSCYQSEEAINKPDTYNEEMPISGCNTVGGIDYCSEMPQNVCDSNGNCMPGCGSVTTGGSTSFVCASPDSDSDGVPDYLDPDIDGDGIPNEQDLDSNGDGIDDPIDTTTNNVRTPHQSTLEQLLGQIAQNTSGGTGSGGSGASANQIGESVAEELEEKLVEQADFSGNEYEQSVNAKIEATDSAIDEFLQDSEKDLTNAFDESEFRDSFTTLKTVLSPNGCSAQFSIPLTGSTLDLCEPASKAQPFLYVIFSISTFIYCIRRIQTTARSE